MLRVGPQRGSQDGDPREIERRVVGRSEALQQVRDRARALARLRVPVTLRGEPGTGRTHVAGALHAASPSPSGPWLVVEADGPAPPAPALAGRTVVIERVDALPASEQTRWLDLLRRSEDGAAGAPRRVLATTSRDLRDCVRDAAFEARLRERLERFTLDLPPLRDRREDVPDLARALGDRAAGRMGRDRVGFTRDALRLLSDQSWPGNVRELARLVERLVAFDAQGRIARAQVAALLREAPVGVASSRRSALQRQREELARAIDEAGGNLAEVARRLEMSRGGVIYRAQKFGLMPRRSR